jgi:hypothetical protein
MLDYLQSKLARREYEERVRAMTPCDDIEAELKRTAGHWQARPFGAFLSFLAKSVSALANRFPHRRAPVGRSTEPQENTAQADAENLEWEVH